MDMEVVLDLGMGILGMEEDLEVAILEVAQVMEEEEEGMVVEVLDLATKVGAPGVCVGDSVCVHCCCGVHCSQHGAL